MIDPKTFYQYYLKDYHRVKARYLKRLIDNEQNCRDLIFGKDIDDETKKSISNVLKSDLRQTYFHAIETFFELFFALNPYGKNTLEDMAILHKLTNSNWRKTQEKINEIARDEMALSFLRENINVSEYTVSIGHYLFYIGIFDNGAFPKGFFDEIGKSLQAIEKGIRILAKDFVHREEYNSYKHGLRIVPFMNRLIAYDINEKKVVANWDTQDSMSFFSKTKNSDEIRMVTILYDVERDYEMIHLCANLIHNMIYFRRLTLKLDSDLKENKPVEIRFFCLEAISKSSTVNVPIQDIVYSVSKRQ